MKKKSDDGIIINEAQLILAEKRTSFAALRTGIAVFALPLTITSLFIVTSKYYELTKVMAFIIPVAIICACLFLLGIYLVSISIVRLYNQERLLNKFKKQNKILQEFIE